MNDLARDAILAVSLAITITAAVASDRRIQLRRPRTYISSRLPLSEAAAINSQGAVVGRRLAGGRAVLWSRSKVIYLPALPSLRDAQIQPTDINDQGTVVGYVEKTYSGAVSTFEYRAFYWIH